MLTMPFLISLQKQRVLPCTCWSYPEGYSKRFLLLLSALSENNDRHGNIDFNLKSEYYSDSLHHDDHGYSYAVISPREPKQHCSIELKLLLQICLCDYHNDIDGAT